MVADFASIGLSALHGPGVIVIDSFARSDEERGLELRRAAAARAYLVIYKDVDPSRILLRWARVAAVDNDRWPGRLRITVVKRGEALPALEAPTMD
jgi:hypothetical protein